MNLNMNPKVLHLALEAVKVLGILAMISKLPFVSALPYAAPIGVVAAVTASAIQTNLIGNIPASTT